MSMPLFHPSFILPKRDAESSSSREPLVVHDPHHPPFQEIIHPHSSIVPRRDETPVSNDTSLPEQETEEDDTPLYLQRTQLTPKDVMFGRGVQDQNKFFRKLCHKYAPSYQRLPKHSKQQLAINLMKYIREQGGRFVIPQDPDRFRVVQDPRMAVSKCAQTMRDAARTILLSQEKHANESTQTAVVALLSMDHEHAQQPRSIGDHRRNNNEL